MEEFGNKVEEMPFYSLQTSFFSNPWRTLDLHLGEGLFMYQGITEKIFLLSIAIEQMVQWLCQVKGSVISELFR